MSKATKTARLTSPRGKRAAAQFLGLQPDELAGRAAGASKVRPLTADPYWVDTYNEKALEAQEKIGEMADAFSDAARSIEADSEDEGAEPRESEAHADPELLFRQQRFAAKRRRRDLRLLGDEERKYREMEMDYIERAVELVQNVKAQDIRLKNENRRENLVMALTGGSFVASLVLAAVGIDTGHVIAFGLSGVTAAGSVAGVFRLFLGRPDDALTSPKAETHAS